MRKLAVAAALALYLGVAAGTAGAETSAQIRSLAAQAAHDPAALARLRRVTVVDGRPADLGVLLGCLQAPRSAAGWQRLASGGEDRARGDHCARAGGAHPRRNGASPAARLPRPFHGILAWLGGKLSFFGRFVRWLGRFVPGGDAVVWGLLGALVMAIHRRGGDPDRRPPRREVARRRAARAPW